MIRVNWKADKTLKEQLVEHTKFYGYDQLVFSNTSYDFLVVDDVNSELQENAKTIFITERLSSTEVRQMTAKGATIYSKQLPIDCLIEMIFGSIDFFSEVKDTSNFDIIEGKAKVISGFSLHGGSGVTTVISNLALLSSRDSKVILVDFTQFGDVSALFGEFKTDVGLDPIASYMSDSLMDSEKFSALVKRNIKVSTDLDRDIHYICAADFTKYDSMGKDIVSYMFKELKSIGYDYIYIDTSKQLNVLNMSILTLSDQIIFVEEPGVNTAIRMMKFNSMISLLSIREKSILIMNKAGKNLPISRKELEKQLHLPIKFCIGTIRNLRRDTFNHQNSKLSYKLLSLIKGYNAND